MASLAAVIGLKAADYGLWSSSIDGAAPPPSATSIVEDCAKFQIPNSIIAYWAGDVGAFGKTWVGWAPNIRYLERLGFYVRAIDHIRGTRGTLVSELGAGTRDGTVHGLYYWGHGFAPYPSSGLTATAKYNKNYDQYVGDEIFSYRDDKRALTYKLGAGFIFACDSNTGKSALSSNALGHIWRGYTRTLYPFGDPTQWSLKYIIRPGEQGAKLNR
jgi:hypothetical protein